MVLTAVLIVLLLWLLGFFTHIGGSFIHILLVVALVIWIVDRLSRSRYTKV